MNVLDDKIAGGRRVVVRHIVKCVRLPHCAFAAALTVQLPAQVDAQKAIGLLEQPVRLPPIEEQRLPADLLARVWSTERRVGGCEWFEALTRTSASNVAAATSP